MPRRSFQLFWHQSTPILHLPAPRCSCLVQSSLLEFVLRLAVHDRYVISPKVGLDDVFYVAQARDQISYWNKINRKHVDFLLCDPMTMRPVAGIELDDASHQREKV